MEIATGDAGGGGGAGDVSGVGLEGVGDVAALELVDDALAGFGERELHREHRGDGIAAGGSALAPGVGLAGTGLVEGGYFEGISIVVVSMIRSVSS